MNFQPTSFHQVKMRALLFLLFNSPMVCGWLKPCTRYQIPQLVVVTKEYHLKIGIVPIQTQDNFDERAEVIGKLNNVSKIAYSPDNLLFYVRDGDLYKAPLICDHKDRDRFSRRVGKGAWDKFKVIFFHPNGDFYAVTTEGDLYKGPEPDNENICWHESVATKIGNGYWDQYEALFFHPNGDLYAVCKDDTLVKGKPPTAPGNWLETTTRVGNSGWKDLTHFMAIYDDGNLWCVDKNNGNIYKRSPPDHEQGNSLDTAKRLGSGYNMYPFICLR